MTNADPQRDPLPVARVAPERAPHWPWILPLLALAFAIYLLALTCGGRGALIRVHARDGHGLQAGDPLRYRGIQVGEVESVALAEDLSAVVLAVRLEPQAAGIAREGSRFWLVRPELSLEGVRGLETIVGANYVAVLPGPPDGARSSEFVALEEAPVAERIEPGGLRVLLESPRRFGLAPGAEIRFRDFQVGTVLSVALSGDATVVEIEAYLRPEYVGLVRENTRFWETGGVEVEFGIAQGLRLEVGTLRSLLTGGVAMATPSEAGAPVASGHRFQLHADPEPQWLDWRPALAVGENRPSALLEPPRIARAELSYEPDRLFARKQRRAGWLLRIEGGWLGPADLLRAAEGTRRGTLLEVEGRSFELGESTRVAGALALLPLEDQGATSGALGAERVHFGASPGDWLILGDPEAAPVPISAARLRPAEQGYELRDRAGLDEAWHGAAVLDRASSMLVGLLVVEGERARIVQPPIELWQPGGDR